MVKSKVKILNERDYNYYGGEERITNKSGSYTNGLRNKS